MPARLVLAAAFCLAALPARADRPDWLWLGTNPGFMMTIRGATATFDYLGDGQYGLEPPVPRDRPDFASRHELVTSRERFGLFLERRSCRVIGADLPVAIEIAIPTSAGIRPMTGCCKKNGE